GMLNYRVDLFDRATAESMVRRFVRLLEQVAQNPGTRVSELALLDDAERHTLLHTWNDTETRPATVPAHVMVERQARRTPAAVALVVPGPEPVEVTYAALNERADRF